MTNWEQGIKLERKAVSRIVLTVVLIGMLTLAFDGGYALAGHTHIWHIETVDTNAWYGTMTSIALNGSDNPHISYYGYDGPSHGLKYVYYDGTWHIEIVDSHGFNGFSIVLDSNDNPHISYYGSDGPNVGLKYAYYDGSWHIEIVDAIGDVGRHTSLALDSNDNPHISYYDHTNHDLKYAYYDGSWHTERVDSVGDVGEYNSIALDGSDNPHISYHDYTNLNLKYAYYDGTWHIETVDGSGHVGWDATSIALDGSDNPHISYYDWAYDNLKYAHYDGTWHIETVDSEGHVGERNSLALDSNDNPHISYGDNTNLNLKYAYYDGSWHIEIVDTTGDVGGTSATSIALDNNDDPHISYFDETNLDLKYAFGEPAYTLTITTTTGGTTDPAPGIHVYPCDSSIQVTAIPDSCHLFGHWELDGDDVGSANPYSVLMDDNHTLHAVFVRIDYDLTITAASGGTTDPAPGIYTYPCDSSIEVTAIPHTYYLFDHWELDGEDVGSANPYSVLMDDEHTLHAVFETTYCQVSPTSLNFGTVVMGSYLDKSFTITNTGEGTLNGTVSETCDDYDIVAGGGAYSLGAGESVTVTVRFEPTSLGQHNCTIETGNDLCGDVSCTGVGGSPCQVSPTSLSFGTVMVGSYVDRSFTITNVGGGTLNGSVSESCDHYAIVSGGGACSLASGQSVTVTVRFEPTSPGQHDCIIETGNALCSDVYCTGVGRGEWYWKLPYDDYAPSGMPDIDQKQDNWIKEETDQWSFCGPCAVANCFKWFDSKYNQSNPGFPGDGEDQFPLVRDYMDDLLPFYDWDDHDPWNVDHIGTQWNPGVGWPPETDQPFLPGPQPQPSGMPSWGELVERLAWYFNTDGIQTGYCDHAGTNVLEMQQGIQDWLESETFEDGNTLADTLCAVITARPTFAYVESLVEKSENVILLLGFWYPGQAPIQQEFQQFIRGDIDENGMVDLGDLYSCTAGGPFSCDDAADVNDDGVLSMADCIYLSNYLFQGGPPPPQPYPNCGLDPTPDELDCGSFALCGSWWRVGGHYVTMAGVNSIEQKIAVSDPFIDAAELGLAEGIVGDGWLIEHVWGEHDPTVHNDEGNVSHDIYLVEESHDPCGLWRLVDYPVSSDPYYWTENFSAQNVPEEFLAVTQQWDEVSPIFTEVEYCLHISPWDYRGDVQPIGGDGVVDLGDLLFLINYLYKGGPAPVPLSEGDVDCNGIIDLGDVLFLISYLYKGGPVPRCCDP